MAGELLGVVFGASVLAEPLDNLLNFDLTSSYCEHELFDSRLREIRVTGDGMLQQELSSEHPSRSFVAIKEGMMQTNGAK